MLDIKFIRENKELVQNGVKNKNISTHIDVDHILEIDARYRELLAKVESLRAERNRLARERDIEGGRRIKDELQKYENALAALSEELHRFLLAIPNIPKPDVKAGKDYTENEVIRTYKQPTQLSFTPRDHVELGEMLDIIDISRATKVSGARFAYLKNEGALLELALVNYLFEFLVTEGFTPIIPPVLIKKDTMQGLGYMENGGEEDMFYMEKDNLFLVGTAEHAIVPMHMNEILEKKDLPKRYVGFSPAFRREAGSYGKDTRGILRVHQFDKVEMVSFVESGSDDQEHEYLLSLEEKIFESLDIPYQVVKMCTGDLGFPAARKYDIEAWMPSQNTYREVTSVSTVTDFQSRRLSIRYKSDKENKYIDILNGTACAIGRTLIAIIENYQQEDGSVVIPHVLQKYIRINKISPK